MKKPVLLYGLLGGVLIALLQAIEYRYLVVEHSLEIYGGLVALVFVTLGIWLGIRLGPRAAKLARPKFDRTEAWRSLMAAKWELLLPIVALVALFGGFATPVEAAAVTAFYAFVVETFVYRDFKKAVTAAASTGVANPPTHNGCFGAVCIVFRGVACAAD